MQLFLGAVPITLRLFSKARGYLLFSNYSRNNLPKPRGRQCHNVAVLVSYSTRMCAISDSKIYTPFQDHLYAE